MAIRGGSIVALLMIAACTDDVQAPVSPATALVLTPSAGAETMATGVEAVLTALAGEAGVSLVAAGADSAVTVSACGADLGCIATFGVGVGASEVVLARIKQRPDETLVGQFLVVSVASKEIVRRTQVELTTGLELERRLRANAEHILGVALPPPPEPAATCEVVEGVVRVQRKSTGEWQPLAPGDGLWAGDVVETGASAVARIVYGSGAALSLNPGAKLVVGESADEGSRVTLHAGTVRGEMAEDAGRVVVMAPDGEEIGLAPEAGSGKLSYRVGVRDDATVEVAVSEGSAAVTTGRGGSATVEAGRAQDVRGGALAGEAVELPDFPQLFFPGIDATVMFQEELRVALKWKAGAAQHRYHVQVAEDQSFHRLRMDAIEGAPTTSFEPPGPATYYWRVATQDRYGREGEYGFSRRLYVTPEKIPDLLVSPADGAELEFESFEPRFVTFSWRAAVPPAPYILMFGRGENIERTRVLDIVTTAQKITTRQLKPGTYYWGVFVKRKSGRKPIFRSSRKFTITQ